MLKHPVDTRDVDHSIILGFACLILLAACYAGLGVSVLRMFHLALPLMLQPLTGVF